jgi:hypothetical protein
VGVVVVACARSWSVMGLVVVVMQRQVCRRARATDAALLAWPALPIGRIVPDHDP